MRAKKRMTQKLVGGGHLARVQSSSHLARLHRDILGCTRCVVAGYLARAAPVLSGYADNRIMLIGQAPGAVEADRRLPFQGRSGKALIQRHAHAGVFTEGETRPGILISSSSTCLLGQSTR